MLLLPVMPAAAQGTGSITGIVTTAAKAPRPIRVTTDTRVCGTSVPDESIVVGPAGQLANVVVTLTGVKAGATAPAEVPVVNTECRFAPRVQLVRPKGTVKATSKDAVLHTTNAQVEGGAPLFNIGLPVPGLTVAKPIGGPGLVRLSCNSHTWMRGWLVVDRRAPPPSPALTAP